MQTTDGSHRDEPIDSGGPLTTVTADVARLAQPIVNVYLVGMPGAGDRGWVLVDAGLPFTAGQITDAAARRFGGQARPAAIVMTHGHFDHVGALEELAERWDVPVYAHELELPYLTGRSPYPPPDPRVGGGAMSWLSFLFPRGPVDIGERARPLPDDGTVPGMPGWRWLHTPGHAPGHVSLYRQDDGLLIAGGRVRHDASGVRDRITANQAAPRPPSAGLLHRRLGRRLAIGSPARRSAAGHRSDRTRPADAR